MNDTSPEIEKIVTDKMKRLSGEERLKMGASMFDMAKKMVLVSLPIQEENECRIRLFLRFYGNDFDEQEREKIIRHIKEKRV